MKIRTQLIGAFLLLAIVPLTAIVLYSYHSSRNAVTRAVEAESKGLNARMKERLGEVKDEIENRVRELPFGALMRDPESVSFGRLVQEMGEDGVFVDTFTIKPVPAPPEPGAPRPPPAPRGLSGFDRHPERLSENEIVLSEDAAAVSLDLAIGLSQSMLSGLEEAVVILEMEAEKAQRIGDQEHLRVIVATQREIVEQRMLAEKQARRQERQAFSELRRAQARELELKRRESKRLLGEPIGVQVLEEGKPIGHVEAYVRVDELIGRVLGTTSRDRGELPFALDGEGRLYFADEADREALETLRLVRDPRTGEVTSEVGDPSWMITSLPDSGRELTFGIARPMGEALDELNRTAMTNLVFGLGLIGFALLGILPLTRRITRGLETVSAGAARIARGDLTTRVPIRSRNEIGQLAMAFNRMARDLSDHQQRLVEEEGRRKEQDLERRLLEAEYERTSRELEDAREFQLSLLPKEVPRHEAYEVAVDMRTATEVGGDYYDFRLDDGGLTIAVGDATGHGATAGTMVAVIKSLFSAAAATELGPSAFLCQAAAAVRRMDLHRMAMALTVARLEGPRLTVSSAGMPPVLVYRAASGEVEELDLAGMPLGGLAFDYQERTAELAAGDTLLFLSDGFPELLDGTGEPLGYEQTRGHFAAAAAAAPSEIITRLGIAAMEWTGSETPQDDLTFVVVRMK